MSNPYDFNVIIKDIQILELFQNYLTQTHQFEEEMYCLISIEKFKEIEVEKERKEKAFNIFSLFFKDGVSFYYFNIFDDEVKREIEQIDLNIEKIKFPQNLFDNLEKYLLNILKEKVFDDFVLSPAFTKEMKKLKKKHPLQYGKFLKLNQNFTSNPSSNSSTASENNSSKSKSPATVNEGNIEIPFIEEVWKKDSKTGKLFYDKNNPHYCKNEYLRICGEYDKFDGWNLLYQKENIVGYVEKDFSFIDVYFFFIYYF